MPVRYELVGVLSLLTEAALLSSCLNVLHGNIKAKMCVQYTLEL